ncbi:hypothetical protein [Sphingomonas bacterium]|uniref:hypothetical protein n=1 Tax=Sphingomonas bacterium TaxID=1895847 RepID=UPI00157759B0|nr:hypothetical protein [Sphingomonas bacterium]
MVGALHRCERLAAELYAEQGRLAQAAIAAETQLGLSAVAGQLILHELGEAQGHAVRARGHLVAGHRQLERLGKRMGLDVEMFGDSGKPPAEDGLRPALGADTRPIVG